MYACFFPCGGPFFSSLLAEDSSDEQCQLHFGAPSLQWKRRVWSKSTPSRRR
jgi:hypothetical protein